MKVIWKFPVDNVHRFSITMPAGAQILCVQMQRERPHLWALVDPEAPKVEREFVLFGTGHSFDEAVGAYIGTYQADDGWLILHVFEGAREEAPA